MMPGGILSTSLVFADYLYPDSLPADPLIDYEMGGVGINDASTGLLIQVWTATLEGTPGEVGTSVWVEAPNTAKTLVFAEDGITEISLTFDQNMQPFIAYVAGGRAKIRWYDATLPGFRVTLLPDGAKAPKCSLDDKRPLATLTATSDILVMYMFSDNLYMLVQRERYATPHTLLASVSNYIANPAVRTVGMNKALRMQIFLSGSLY